jgi:hypothetical protein
MLKNPGDLDANPAAPADGLADGTRRQPIVPCAEEFREERDLLARIVGKLLAAEWLRSHGENGTGQNQSDRRRRHGDPD